MKNFKIHKATKRDIDFIISALQEFENISISTKDFSRYLYKYFLQDNSVIYIAEKDGEKIGLITVNKLPAPRYIGHSYEIEEVIITGNAKGKGYGKIFVQKIIKLCKQDPDARKIIVKTDGDIAKNLYRKYFTEQKNVAVFQKFLNKI